MDAMARMPRLRREPILNLARSSCSLLSGATVVFPASLPTSYRALPKARENRAFDVSAVGVATGGGGLFCGFGGLLYIILIKKLHRIKVKFAESLDFVSAESGKKLTA
jgi:hypothetical protein